LLKIATELLHLPMLSYITTGVESLYTLYTPNLQAGRTVKIYRSLHNI